MFMQFAHYIINIFQLIYIVKVRTPKVQFKVPQKVQNPNQGLTMPPQLPQSYKHKFFLF
jgi:hypothetical protein